MACGLALAPSASAQGTKFATEVPLLDCDGTPCVEARIGVGKPVRMGIDTGNVASVVDTDLANAAGLKAVGEMPSGAPAGVFQTSIPSVEIGEVKLTGVPALALGLGNMISRGEMPHLAGTLAYTAFRDRILQLDFAAHKVRISEVLKSPLACEGSCDKFSLINFGEQGPAIVVARGFEINGKSVMAQVDTMYTGSLLVYTASIEKLGLSAAAKTERTRDFPLTDGGVKMLEAPSAKESFHGTVLGVKTTALYFPTPDVHEPDGLFDATVGLELFYGTVLTLNFHDMTIRVEKR
jgi:hypothetical protein